MSDPTLATATSDVVATVAASRPNVRIGQATPTDRPTNFVRKYALKLTGIQLLQAINFGKVIDVVEVQ
jgi:hypothetical protein